MGITIRRKKSNDDLRHFHPPFVITYSMALTAVSCAQPDRANAEEVSESRYSPQGSRVDSLRRAQAIRCLQWLPCCPERRDCHRLPAVRSPGSRVVGRARDTLDARS